MYKRQRQGVYVSDYRKSGSLDTLTALVNYNGGVMRDDEVRSLLEVRSANECLCVKLVVERATQEELDGLAPLLDAIKSGKTDEERAEATFQFHHALSVLSRNAFLPLLYNSIHTYGLHFWSLYSLSLIHIWYGLLASGLRFLSSASVSRR